MSTFQDLDRRAASRTGSFWTDNLGDSGKKKAVMLNEVGSLMRYAEPLEIAVAALTGSSWADDFNIDLTFAPTSVQVYGALPQVSQIGGMPFTSTVGLPPLELPVTSTSIIQNGEISPAGNIVYPDPQGNAISSGAVGSIGVAYYGLRLPPDISPIRVTANTGDLLINQDFFVRNNVILFRRHPSTLFPNSVMPVRALRRSVFSLNAPAMGVDVVYGSTEQVAKYHRYDTSVGQWLAAACQAASIGVFNCTSVIRAIVPLEIGCLYVTDYEIITCDYPHTQLALDDTVTAGQIPGNVISFQWGKFKSQDWWANTFPSGIPLGNLCSVPGLSVPAGSIAVVYLGSASSTQMHVGLALGGDPAFVTQYQQQCKMVETLTGNYLWQALGIPLAPTDTPIGTVLTAIPAVQFFMKWLLGSRMVVITESLKAAGALRHKRLCSFLSDHRPVGVIPLVVSI